MTTPRSSPYLYATWPTKYLTGDKSCLWACWFKTHHQNYEKAPSDFDLVRWQAEHTVLVNSLVNDLEKRGCKVFIEHQNSFRIESRKSGLMVSGRPDLIAKHPDGRTVIYDAKTGRESTSHLLQVQLYMYLLPKLPESRWHGTRFEGAVVYADGTERHIRAESIDNAFIDRLTDFMQKMASDMPARRVPSAFECGQCDLTSGDCPEKIEPVAA
ncbi:MAG: PD-(D/E)XK nuclease family protein [Chloroflexota bacterium]|nr:PD-(D/E)XK nuclease family protein [Chloroflexota bacterium]